MSLLQEQNVVVDVAASPNPWFTILVANGLPLLLLVGMMVWMGRRAAQNQRGLFGFGKTKARRYTGDRPQVTFDDVAGADEVKTDLQEVVDFLRNPLKYHGVGARMVLPLSAVDNSQPFRR
jgi:cell division protease FtsH